MALDFQGSQGEPLIALAALNPGFFLEAFDAILAHDRAGTASQAFLARYDGVPLVSLPASPGTGIHFSSPLLQALHADDGGVIETALPQPSAASPQPPRLLPSNERTGILSWRVSSRYPLVVVLGLSDADLMARWWTAEGGLMGGGLLVLFMVVGLIVLLVTQVTFRARLQDKVRVLSQAIDQGPTAVLITDRHGQIEYVNRAFTQMLGYAGAEVYGQTPRCVKSGMMSAEVYVDLWKTISSGRIWNGELLNRTADGDLRWMSAAVAAVQGEDGVITHYVAVETDVTERKQVQKRLAEMQQLAEGLLKLPIVLYRLNSQGLLTDVLGNGLARIGIDRLELIGQRFSRVFELQENFDEQALAGKSVRFESSLRCGSKVFYLDHLLAPDVVEEPAEPAPHVARPMVFRRGAIGFALDVSARKEAEDRLSAMVARLDASNHELEQFAYVASHDLQEPLRTISSYLSLLRRRYGDQLDQNAHEFIDFAVDGARRMQGLILDLLQLSRVGTQGSPLEPVDVGDVLELTRSNLSLTILDAGARLTVAAPMPQVMADSNQLVRLFQNLIGNAIKYRSPLRSPEVIVTSQREGAFWQFTVADNGQGIDPAFHERVFMIFQRLHTREQAEGNGIGLAVCRKIVERHGGRIWVESTPGEGCRFCFTLPATGTTPEGSDPGFRRSVEGEAGGVPVA